MIDPLAELRDIHLPDPVPWWPPAPGWWLLALLLLTATVCMWWLRRRYFERFAVRRLVKAGLGELKRIEHAYRIELDNGALVRRLSALLRRIAVSRYPRREAAALTGEHWLQLLDRRIGRPEFSRGIGRILTSAPYQAEPQLDAEALLALCREWIISPPPQQPETERRDA
ncbi:MAG TPA: DUF4381 domain-containing protein [Gammaproteobacteria bacterium]|jgi:hypothetical protein